MDPFPKYLLENIKEMEIKKNSKPLNIVEYAKKELEKSDVERILFKGNDSVTEKVVTHVEILKRKMLPMKIYQWTKFENFDDQKEICLKILLSKKEFKEKCDSQQISTDDYGSQLPNLSKTIPRIPVKRIGVDVERKETMKKNYFSMDDYADKLLPIVEDLTGPKQFKKIMPKDNPFMKPDKSMKSKGKDVEEDDDV